MILECDIGNTACKWRLVDAAGHVGDKGWFNHSGVGFERLSKISDIKRVRAATVAKPEVARRLEACIAGEFGLSVEWAETQKKSAGVVNAYEDVSRLGVDRWLVAVAGYQLAKGAVVIVDAGSALTVDVVDGSGQHLGGYIVPGLELMKSSLLTDTKGVRFAEDKDPGSVAFGASTDRAVHSGVMAAQLGVIRVALEQADKLFAGKYRLYMAGGDSECLLPYLDERADWQPDLVLDGLKWLLP